MTSRTPAKPKKAPQSSLLQKPYDSKPEVEPKKYYFAYGSNLAHTQMARRCPSAGSPVGVALLRGWKWIINERGYANIVEVDDDGKEVAAVEVREEEPEAVASSEASTIPESDSGGQR